MTALCTHMEDDCWTLFREGNRTALDSIVKTHYNLLYNYGRKFTQDSGMVKDCIQELFLALWKNRATIGEPASVPHYLLKALRRRLQSALAHANRHYTGDLEFLEIETSPLQSPELSRMQEELQSEFSKTVIQAFSGLSRRQQEIIYLRFYLEADAREISQIMGLSRQSVYNLLNTALDRLKHMSINLSEQRTLLSVGLLVWGSEKFL